MDGVVLALAAVVSYLGKATGIFHKGQSSTLKEEEEEEKATHWQK